MAGESSVVIADAQAINREGLASLAQKALPGVRVLQCDHYSGLIHTLSSHPETTLALIDLDLPELSSISTIRETRERFAQVNIAVISDRLVREVALECVSSGLHGFVVKSSSQDELTFALTALISGRLYYPRALTDISEKDEASANGSLVLSRRQLEILTLLATGKANKEIARELNIAEGTVKVHLNAAFRILGVHNRVAAVCAMRDFGGGAARKEPTLPGIYDSPATPDPAEDGPAPLQR